MSFPEDYPMAPPQIRFLSEMWHPNGTNSSFISFSVILFVCAVYIDGRLCISILHPPGDDELSGESAFERWLPVQTVETVLLSVQSLLGEPNPSSPANVDAGVRLLPACSGACVVDACFLCVCAGAVACEPGCIRRPLPHAR